MWKVLLCTLMLAPPAVAQTALPAEIYTSHSAMMFAMTADGWQLVPDACHTRSRAVEMNPYDGAIPFLFTYTCGDGIWPTFRVCRFEKVEGTALGQNRCDPPLTFNSRTFYAGNQKSFVTGDALPINVFVPANVSLKKAPPKPAQLSPEEIEEIEKALEIYRRHQRRKLNP